MRPYIAATVSAASLLVGLAALPPFQVGIWIQSEPAEIALFAIGALAALVIIGRPGGSHPFVWIPLVLAGWSVLASCLLPFPARSWFGPPETGEGAAWWLAVAALVSCGMTAAAHLRSVIQLSTALAALIYAVVLAVDPESLGRWSAWAGFIAPLVALIVQPRWVALVLAAFLVSLSGSKGAAVLCGLAFVLWLALEAVAEWRPHRMRLAGVVAVVAVVSGSIAATLALPWPSAASRAVLWTIAADSLHSSGALALGHGWGAFNDLVLADWQSIAARVPDWEGLGAGAFHSHSLLTESTLALGLPGLALVLGLMVAVPMLAADVKSYSGRIVLNSLPWTLSWWAAWCGIACIWFPLPVGAPFLALALAYVSGRTPSPSWRASLWPVAAVASLAVTSWLVLAQARNATAALEMIGGPVPASFNLNLSDNRGDQHLWALSMMIEVDTARRAATGGAPVEELMWRDVLRFHVEREIAAGRASDRLRSMALFWR